MKRVTRDDISGIESSAPSADGKNPHTWSIILLAGVFVALVIGVSFYLIYMNSKRLMEESAWVAHTHQVVAHLESLLGAATDIETGQRGFVISGNAEFLEPFEKGVTEVDRHLREIRELTSDNENQMRALDRLEPLIRQKIEISQSIIDARRGQGISEAAAIVSSAQGKRVMDEIRRSLDAMLAEENRLLIIRSEKSRRISERINLDFLVLSTFNVVAITGAMGLALRNTRKRKRAELKLYEKQRGYVRVAEESARAAELARISAERSAMVRDQLLSNAYHELRTPLTAILGFSELLEQDDALDEASRDISRRIHQNGKQLMALTENLLEAASATSGGEPTLSTPIPVNPTIRAAIDQLQPAIDAKGISLRILDEAGNPNVRINPRHLQAVLERLIDNAVKFSELGGRVNVFVRSEGEKVTISVVDEGVGISASALDGIFKAFRQEDASPSKAHGGLGMGLFVSRFYIENYGGTLTAESLGEGRGAKFVVTLPLAEASINP